jgi:glycosyltransferase involved in cell wall biosynthesis
MTSRSNAPKISIVTACLNHGEYLEDAILSVMRQGYPNFEHIVIDGVSKDNTIEVLKRYPHVRWISEPDRGQSDALNKGFKMATGDLVGWMNADEFYMPGAFAAMAKAAAANPKSDVFYGDVLFVDKDGRLQRSKTAHDFDFNVLLYYGCFIITATTFFRRQIFDEQMMLDMDYRVVMDFEYFVRLASQGKKFKYVNQIIGAFRWLGTNASLQHTRRRNERLRVQRTWSPRKMSDRGYDALAKFYQTKRLLMKTFNGAYRKEFRVLRHAPKQTLWFRTHQSFETCRSLMSKRQPRTMDPNFAT